MTSKHFRQLYLNHLCVFVREIGLSTLALRIEHEYTCANRRVRYVNYLEPQRTSDASAEATDSVGVFIVVLSHAGKWTEDRLLQHKSR